MAINRLSTILLVLAASFAAVTSAQTKQNNGDITAKEWVELSAKDNLAARKALGSAYNTAQANTAAQYRSRGDNDRATYIETLEPKIKDVVGRLVSAKANNPDKKIVDIIADYFVDVSSPEIRSGKRKQ